MKHKQAASRPALILGQAPPPWYHGYRGEEVGEVDEAGEVEAAAEAEAAREARAKVRKYFNVNCDGTLSQWRVIVTVDGFFQLFHIT